MKRLSLTARPQLPTRRPKAEGRRIVDSHFGTGTVIAEGPEVSTVVFDDDSWPAPMHVPNRHFKKMPTLRIRR